jgi:hypothetical protein
MVKPTNDVGGIVGGNLQHTTPENHIVKELAGNRMELV